MPNTHVRVLGGGNTYIEIGLGNTAKLELCAQFVDNPGKAVGSVTPIQPIGSKYPIEITTPYAQGAGTIQIQVYGTWDSDGWVSAFQTLEGEPTAGYPWKNFGKHYNDRVAEPVDLVEVMEAQRNNDTNIIIKKFELGKKGNDYVRVKEYHGVVVTDIAAGETITNGQMEQKATITFQYTYMTLSHTGAAG